MESRRLGWLEVTSFPKQMRAGQGRVSAKLHFHLWREPAQIKTVVLARRQKRRFRKRHFPRHLLHPISRRRRIQHANASRIAKVFPFAKGIDLVEGHVKRM